MGFRALGIVVGLPGTPPAEAVELAELAESAGVGLVAAGDGPVENLAMLGALAARTRRVELASTVAGWSRSPVTTALGASTVQALSEGRYRIALGPTPRAWSEGWHGVSYERPVQRMRDFVAAMRAAWRSEPHDGPFYRVAGYRHPLPGSSPVPVSLAATQRGMTRLAGEVADGAVLNLVLARDWLADVSLPALAEGLAASGRARGSLDVGLLRMAAVDDDPERARDRLRPGLGFYFTVPYVREVLEHAGLAAEAERGFAAAARGDAAGMAASVSDRLIDAMALAGTVDDVRAGLARYEGLADWVELMPALGGTPVETREQTERLIDAIAGG